MPKSKIDETIRALAAASSKTSSRSISADKYQSDMLGDPNCPHCHGIGYLRTDLPVGHPDFGKLEICVCRRAKITGAVRQRLYALSHLDELQRLTFETFSPRGRQGLPEPRAESLQSAFNQSKHYAENLQGWLVLQGDPGCGKTHLAAAVANYAVGMGVPTLFLTVPDLLDTLRFAYDSEDTTFEGRFDEIRNATLLVLDDFGMQNATGWAQEKLFQIMNYRYINRLSTIVTTNLLLDEIEPRIRSRLADPQLVTKVRINAPDYRQPVLEEEQSQLSSLGLHAGRTFDSFSLRKDEGLDPDAEKSLASAFEAARAYARKPRGWLVLSGEYASGKTHLAAAIANERAAGGNPPLFVVVPDLLDHFRAAFSPNSTTTFDRRFYEARTAPLLVLDDLGTESMTPWVREKLYQLFNYRYNAELPTVITIATDALKELDKRLLGRLQDTRLCKSVNLTATPYQGKPSRLKPRPRR